MNDLDDIWLIQIGKALISNNSLKRELAIVNDILLCKSISDQCLTDFLLWDEGVERRFECVIALCNLRQINKSIIAQLDACFENYMSKENLLNNLFHGSWADNGVRSERIIFERPTSSSGSFIVNYKDMNIDMLISANECLDDILLHLRKIKLEIPGWEE